MRSYGHPLCWFVWLVLVVSGAGLETHGADMATNAALGAVGPRGQRAGATEVAVRPQGRVARLVIEPSAVELAGRQEKARVLVTAEMVSGDVYDVTTLSKWGVEDRAVASVDGKGRIQALGEGSTLLTVRFGGMERQVPVRVSSGVRSGAGPGRVSFVRDVLPVLSKAGCNAGACHAKPDGQNGFKLSVFSYDPKSDYFEIVKEGRGRRVFPSAPEESLLLAKPTLAVPHEGGQRLVVGSAEHRMIVRWITEGMTYANTNEPSLNGISVFPKERRYRRGAAQQLMVRAQYSDGTTRDVTDLAVFDSNDKEMARVTEGGVVTAGTLTGEGIVVARFMGLVDASRVTVPAEKLLPSSVYASLPRHNFIDGLAYEQFQKLGLKPSEECTDAEFLRRASLDAIGVLPTVEETRLFLADTGKDKRARLIDRLLKHPAYGDYWANKWADLLRPNPDRVGVKSVFTLDQWLRESFAANKPYDQFAREVLMAQGSNHRDGPAVVYRDRREPAELTTMFSQVFLGLRMECAKCHHHPNEKWAQEDFYQLAAYFGPVRQKGAGLSPPISAGTETFFYAPGGEVRHPVTGEVMKPRPPDGPTAASGAGGGTGDPRESLVRWMTDPSNPFFARAMANRVWSVFFGRGIVDPVDDFRVSNPASNERLLSALAEEFAGHGYDLKHLMRVIMNSRVYQLSSLPNETNLADTKNFSRAYRRRLSAEVLLDAVSDVTGTTESFTGMPPGSRAMQAWTYKIDSHFLDAFSRPNSSSDCPCERDRNTSVVQSLHMMNSRNLQAKLSDAKGRVKRLVESGKPVADVVTELYLATYSRYPTSAELASASKAFEAKEATRQTAAEDVLWALLNSPEFVFNH